MEVRCYLQFQSDRVRVPCTFLYPADWKVEVTTEERYTVVYIVGPSEPTGVFTVSFRVLLSSEPEQTLNEAVECFVRKFRSAFEIQVVGQASGRVAELPAVDIEVAFRAPLPPDSVSPKMTDMYERRVFIKRQGHLFEFSYRAPQKDYKTWLEAFRILLCTFSVLEEGPNATFHPLVAQVTSETKESSGGMEAGETSQ